MAITKLFSLYKDSYARQLPETEDGFVGYKSMSEQHLSQTAQNEFLLKNDDGRSVRIKKHGTNFYHRCVSWVEARVFSRAGRIRDTRQQASTDFAQAVSHALFEMGIDGHDEHPTVLMIREHASKSLPLRSSVVRDVLEEVAELGYRQSRKSGRMMRLRTPKKHLTLIANPTWLICPIMASLMVFLLLMSRLHTKTKCRLPTMRLWQIKATCAILTTRYETPSLVR